MLHNKTLTITIVTNSQPFVAMCRCQNKSFINQASATRKDNSICIIIGISQSSHVGKLTRVRFDSTNDQPCRNITCFRYMLLRGGRLQCQTPEVHYLECQLLVHFTFCWLSVNYIFVYDAMFENKICLVYLMH